MGFQTTREKEVIIDRTFVIEELEKLSIRKKINNDSIAICCPWHKESDPSCFVSIEEGGKVNIGTFHCFGCGISGSWNTLAEHLGLKLLPKNGNEDSKLIANHIKSKIKKVPAPEEVSNIALFSRWRGSWIRRYTTFEYAFLRQFNPLRFYDQNNGIHRIVFNVTTFGDRLGHVIEGNGDGYHHFSKGEWISKALFPFDRLSGKAVVLVEGIADALNLIRNKIPALCFFGVENWNDYKGNLLAAKGVEIVCTVCDGDEQGYNCNRKIAADLEDKFDVRILDLPKRKHKVDPEVVPSHILRVIKNMCAP